MIAKVAYLCAIMAAVQSRSTLYGTSILDLIIPDNRINMNPLNVSRAESGVIKSDKWKHSVYDIASKILQSVRNNFQFEKSVIDVSSPGQVSSSLPNPQFITVTHSVEPSVENDVPKHTVQKSGVVPFIITSNGNETIANFFEFIRPHLSKDIMQHGIPGLAAFDYHH